MTEDITFRHRRRDRRHSVTTSNVLLYCYPRLTDGAKITYQIIDGMDWEDHDTKVSKGCAWPATKTLAKYRQTTERTIQRHLKELVAVQLLTRVRRRNQASIFYIEDLDPAEIKRYFELIGRPEIPENKGSNQPPSGNDDHGGDETPGEFSTIGDRDNSLKSRNDKNVVSGEGSETTKMSFAYIRGKKEEEREEKEFINVKSDLQNFKLPGNGKPRAIGELLTAYRLPKPQKSWPRSVKKLKRDALASELADKLNDHQSLGCLRVIAETIPTPVLFQTLGSVKEAHEQGLIRESMGALFVGIIKHYAEERGLELGFQMAGKTSQGQRGP